MAWADFGRSDELFGLANVLSGMMSDVLSRDAERLATRENDRQQWMLQLCNHFSFRRYA